MHRSSPTSVLCTTLKQMLAQRQQAKQQVIDQYNWQQQARPNQRLPDGLWRLWLVLAGRGYGKTRVGAETVRDWAIHQGYRRIALIADTENDARQVMIEGQSGLLHIHPPHERPRYEPSKRTLYWPNGAQATCYSAENYQQLRGPQFDAAWIDELAKFRNIQQTWDQLNMALRLGSAPRIVVTTTPRPVPLIRQLLQQKPPDVYITRGTTYENAANLSADFINFIQQNYEHAPFGQQEIMGEMVEVNQQALWNYQNLQAQRCFEHPPLQRIVVAIDPAVTNNVTSDETGIIVAGRDHQDNVYVLEDLSGRFSCQEWAMRAVQAYHRHQADLIVAEVNKGGDLVKEMLRAVDATVPYQGLHASRGKITRAEPVAALYQQKRVFHVGHQLQLLENQLCTYTANNLSASPDRMDALVWAVTELVMQKNVKKQPKYQCWSLHS